MIKVGMLVECGRDGLEVHVCHRCANYWVSILVCHCNLILCRWTTNNGCWKNVAQQLVCFSIAAVNVW